MHYDPNYRNQFFKADGASIGIGEALDIARREIAVAKYKTKMPQSKLSKITLYAVLGVSVLVLLVSGLVLLITRSSLFAIVLFALLAFFSIGIIAIIVLVAGAILRKNCSEPVEATCIGYSYSASSNNGSTAGRLARTPVFEYEYHGLKCVAFDGVYDNFSQGPMISQTTTIMVNPSDPEDIEWNFGASRRIFLILAIAFSAILSTAMFLVVINDENFMKAALGKEDPVVEVSSELQGGALQSEIASGEEIFAVHKTDDGRIILDDAYLRNEVFTRYPDAEYVVKKRLITKVEAFDDGPYYVITFKEDPDCSETEWYFSNDEITDEVKNYKAGDELIYAEVKEVGACWVFSTKEYATDGE